MSSSTIEYAATDDAFSSDQILRSINIVFDAEHPERISHFFPTTKSVQLLNQMLGTDDSAGRFVVAPYGSGKSLLAAFYHQIIENRPSAISQLRAVIDRVGQVDSDLHARIEDRTSGDHMFRPTGIVVPLSGYVKDLPEAIYSGLLNSLKRLEVEEFHDKLLSMPHDTMDDLVGVLSLLREQRGTNDFDHIDVLWDEFGRHLEEIVVRGEAHRLNELQLLSEFAVRSKRITMNLVLFLHQSLMRYASNVPQSVTHEWKKIEGRFETHQYVDDSKEVITLAARVLESRFPDRHPNVETKQFHLHLMRRAGLFSQFADTELDWIIEAAWPVLPSALFVLPRISSRVAQNERTLFSFLYEYPGDDVITPSKVFDYFSDLMRSDTTFGGTYHHWLETQNALANAEHELDIQIIKTLSLYALGLAGERNRVSRELLRVACTTEENSDQIGLAIDELIDRKVLLYRKNADTVLLWHATDIDLRGRLESEKTRLFNTFGLLEYLNEFLPPEDWRPVEYNARKKMFRYFAGSFLSANEVSKSPWMMDGWDAVDSEADGIVLYILPETESDLVEARAALSNVRTDPRIVSLVPRTAEGLFETSLEAASIQRLLKDSSLAAEDPLVVPELQQMLDDTQAYLISVIDRMYSPSPEGPEVIAEGTSYRITSRREFRSFLSDRMERVYPSTPVLNNELINKMSPSRVIANARKKLTLGILDRYGTTDLGLEGNRPDRSMFATLLLRTGLYFEDDDGRWRFARPGELQDRDLSRVWEIVREFFSEGDGTRRPFSELYDELQSPPIGLRSGVMPLLLAAGFRAFPAAMTLTGPDGNYIPDIKPSVIEEIDANPEGYTIAIVPLDTQTNEYLREIERIFSDGHKENIVETDPLRRCYDAMEAWKARLPLASLQSKKFSQPAQVFQRLVARAQDPAKLLLQDLYSSFGVSHQDWKKLVEHISQWKAELEGVVGQYYDAAARSIQASLQLNGVQSIQAAGNDWVKLLPSNVKKLLRDGVSKALIQRFSMPYESDRVLIDSISSLLIGKRIDRWDDSTVALFDREFRNAVRRIEDEALGAAEGETASLASAKSLVSARLESLYSRLQNLVGKEEARQIVANIIKEEE